MTRLPSGLVYFQGSDCELGCQRVKSQSFFSSFIFLGMVKQLRVGSFFCLIKEFCLLFVSPLVSCSSHGGLFICGFSSSVFFDFPGSCRTLKAGRDIYFCNHPLICFREATSSRQLHHLQYMLDDVKLAEFDKMRLWVKTDLALKSFCQGKAYKSLR